MEKFSLSGLLLLAAVSYATANVVMNNEGDFIINGVNAGASEFPHMALLKNNNVFTCGGSLVADNIVLTAKHCVYGAQPSRMRVEMAVWNRDRATNYVRGYRIKKFILHSNTDIALLVLTQKVWLNSYTKKVDLSATAPPDQQNVTIAGFGWTVAGGGSSSTARILQKVTIPVQPSFMCLRDGVYLNVGEFCAGIESETYTNACHGDSGGPVQVKQRDGTWQQVGVVVRGVGGCPNRVNHAAFVNTSYIYSWVNDNVRANTHFTTTTPRYIPPPTPIAPSGGQEGCFTSDSLVETPVGSKPVADLETGDLVRAMSPDGKLMWSPMLMFIHADKQQAINFVYISTEGQATPLKLTANHLLFKSTPEGRQDVLAGDVAVGDQLLMANTHTGVTRAAAVASVSVRSGRGIYAPLTEAGTVVVDGVAASCYATLTSHDTAHAGFAPVRWLHSLFDVKAGDLSIGDGVHWYPAMLESVLVGTIF